LTGEIGGVDGLVTPGTVGRVVPVVGGRVVWEAGGFVVVVVPDVGRVVGVEVDDEEEPPVVVVDCDGGVSLCVEELAGDPQAAAATPRATRIANLLNFGDMGPLDLEEGGSPGGTSGLPSHHTGRIDH
jgi:hypothetical protein